MTETPERTGRSEPRADRTGGEREPIPFVDDPWSKVFVAVVIAVFALIFAYAFLLGTGGLLTATPSPTPTPIATASPSPALTP